ncbi:MAG: hypothetical protein AAGD86_01255 [Pseudomonadota bacterium]
MTSPEAVPSARGRAGRWLVPTLIAAAIALVAVVLSGVESERTPTVPAVSAAARDSYAEARALLDGGAGDLERAERLLADAVAAAPHFADAWAATAELWLSRPLPTADTVPPAKRAALTALEHDPDHVEARLQLAQVAIAWDRNWGEAQQLLVDARELASDNPAVHQAIASLRFQQGRVGEAEAAMLMGVSLKPTSVVLNTDLAWHYTVSGKYERALATCGLLERLDAARAPSSTCTLQPLLLSGDGEGAAAVARRVLERLTGHAPGEKLAPDTVLALFWRTTLDRLVDASEQRYVDPVHFARLHAQLGDDGSALDALALAVQQRSQLAPLIHVFPEFRALHDSRRFLDLLGDLGLPDDPRQVLARLH